MPNMLTMIAFTMLAGFAVQESPMAAQAPMEPPPGMSAQMEQAHAQMRSAVLNSLSAGHRSQAQAIAARFNNGDVSMCQAAEQIGGILSPSESAQVITAVENIHKTMPPMPGPPGAHITMMNRMHHGKPDAGEIVLMATAMP